MNLCLKGASGSEQHVRLSSRFGTRAAGPRATLAHPPPTTTGLCTPCPSNCNIAMTLNATITLRRVLESKQGAIPVLPKETYFWGEKDTGCEPKGRLRTGPKYFPLDPASGCPGTSVTQAHAQEDKPALKHKGFQG